MSERRHVYFGVWRKKDGRVYPVRSVSHWTKEEHERDMVRAREIMERLR